MAGPYKGVIFFHTGDSGWTETHYMVASTLSGALTALDNICTNRMAISDNHVLCGAIRVSDLSAPRTSLAQVPTNGVGTYSTTDQCVDPNIARLYALYSSDGLTRSRIFLRGLPYTTLLSSPVDPFTWSNAISGWNTAFGNYRTAILAQTQLVVRKPGPTFITKSISTTGLSNLGTVRKSGRPFSLRRGRRLLV